jgi:hypothetical protein
MDSMHTSRRDDNGGCLSYLICQFLHSVSWMQCYFCLNENCYQFDQLLMLRLVLRIVIVRVCRREFGQLSLSLKKVDRSM